MEAHHFDAMVLLAGCDKIIPGMIMAAARLDIPAVIVPGGPMLPGNVGGNPLFCSSEGIPGARGDRGGDGRGDEGGGDGGPSYGGKLCPFRHGQFHVYAV